MNDYERPSGDTSANFVSRFTVEGTGRPAKPKPVRTEPPRIVRLLKLAEEWQRMLDSGEARFRAEIARRASVSAMRVTQVLALLKLQPEIRESIRGLRGGTPERLITERALRSLAGWDRDQQLEMFSRLAGTLLDEFCDKRPR